MLVKSIPETAFIGFEKNQSTVWNWRLHAPHRTCTRRGIVLSKIAYVQICDGLGRSDHCMYRSALRRFFAGYRGSFGSGFLALS